MKRYSNKKKYIKILLVVILLLGMVIFTTYSLRKERELSFVERTIKDASSFIVDTLYAPIAFIKNKIEVYNEKDNIYKKYKKIKDDVEDIDQKEARISELEKENKELRDSLSLNSSLSVYDYTNATVVSRDVGHWYDKFVIDKGEKEGIKKRMAVVVNNGLIGYISETSSFSSNVQLLTTSSLKNKISVKIEVSEGKFANGLLNGYDSKKKIYSIEGISYSGDIPKKAIVTTTGLTENFPSGILVGYVKNITTDNFDLGKIVEVTPSVDFENISYVTVLKRKAVSN